MTLLVVRLRMFTVSWLIRNKCFVGVLLVIPVTLVLVALYSLESRAEEPSSQESRASNAQSVVKRAQQFKENAAHYHALSAEQMGRARDLSAQAGRLNAKAKSLNAHIQQNVDTGKSGFINSAQYQSHLVDFQKHAHLYNAHLADYEKQLLQAQTSEGQLQSACRQYADHVARYHVPGAKPPHVCVQLQQETKEMQQAANRFREDQDRTRTVEIQLAQQESKLQDAARQRQALERKLLQQAGVAEVEQGVGLMVLREYQELEREYRILQTEKERLGLVK